MITRMSAASGIPPVQAPRAPFESAPAQASSARAEKRRVAGTSILAALLITGLKALVGVTTQSLGILSEALHSALDLIAAIITFFTIHVSDRPADADHPYGHEKFENFSAFLQVGLLVLTCGWIVWEALKRLLLHTVEIEPSFWAFGVMALSVAVDWGRSRALSRVATKYNSQALEADALHFSTDIWSSLVVIFGLVLVVAGRALGIPELAVADALSAIAVSGMVLHISLRLGKKTVDALLDAAPAGLRARVAEEVVAVDGVLSADRVRLRHAGKRFFVDARIAVRRTATLEQAKAVSDAVQSRIEEFLPGADVMIHTEPRASRTEDVFERVRAAATRHKVNVHDLSILDSGEDGLHLELHLEVDEQLSLRQAHDLVTQVEAEIQQEAPGLASINSHIEEAGAHIEPAARATERADRMVPRLRHLAETHEGIRDCHEVTLRLVRDRLYVSCHCTLDGKLPISVVHEITAEVEARFRREFPEIFRVIIHSEPDGSR